LLQFAFDDRYVRPEGPQPAAPQHRRGGDRGGEGTRTVDDARPATRYRSVRPSCSRPWNEHLEGSAVEWTDEHGYGYVMVADRAFR
jgi:hypothetical protein